MVLVPPRARRVEHERLALARARPQDVVVEPERDDPHALAVEPELRDRPVAHEVADRDHALCAPQRAVPQRRAQGALRPREQRRQVEVLDVVERDHLRQRRFAAARSSAGSARRRRPRGVPRAGRGGRRQGPSRGAAPASRTPTGTRARRPTAAPRRRPARPGAAQRGRNGSRSAPRPRSSSRTYVSLPPSRPGTSVSSEIRQLTQRSYWRLTEP